MSDKIPDSRWIASMVVAAFTEERFELGAALARLCVQAERMEQDAAPLPAPVVVGPEVYASQHVQTHTHEHAAPCRYEGHPTTPHLCSAGGVPLPPNAFEDHADTAEEMDSYLMATPAGRETAENLAPSGNAVTAVQPVIPSARCIAIVGAPGGGRECHGVLYWAEADSVSVAGWEHLDGLTDHQPVPDREGPR